MVKRIVKSIYLVLIPLQKRLLRKVPWAKFGFLFLGGKICIFNIRDGEERERKKKVLLRLAVSPMIDRLTLFFSRAFERLARLLARTLPLKTNAHYDTKYHHSSRQKLDCCSPPSPRLGHGRGGGGLTEILQRSSKDSLGKKPLTGASPEENQKRENLGMPWILLGGIWKVLQCVEFQCCSTRELWFHCFFSFHCFSIIHWRWSSKLQCCRIES